MALDMAKRNELKEWVRRAEGLDAEQKSALLGLLSEHKRYGLVWEEKPEDAYEKLRTHLPVFQEVPERRIEGASPESPDHILIEGDNLHALTALQYTHAGKVDVIYIDPPYNTGNKDFTYNDSFVDKEDAWRHSKWLCFMEKRLKLAKDLLKDTGVIFISIDDNEQAQLKLLCDQVFGENSFIAHLPTIMNLKGNQDEFAFAGTHENTIVYCKSPTHWIPGQFQLDEDAIDDWDSDSKGAFKKGASLKSTGVNAPREKRPNLYFPVFVKPDGDWYTTEDNVPINTTDAVLLPITAGQEMSWRWSKAKFKKDAMDVIVTGEYPDFVLYKKQRPSLGELPSKKPKSIFYRPEYSSGNGTAELKDVFGGEKIFGNPKPIELITDFLKISSTKKEFLILDFFAGSGTTLHATMALNAEDGGKRQCILVTNNENRICEKVTYERNKRVIQGYTNAKGQAVEGLVNNTLRYYQLQFVERVKGQKERRLLASALKDLLCIKEKGYTPHPSLHIEGCAVFSSDKFLLFLVHDPDAVEEAVEAIASQSMPCKVYVYSPDADPFSVDFEEVQDRVELYALPEAYYQALRQCLPEVEV